MSRGKILATILVVAVLVVVLWHFGIVRRVANALGIPWGGVLQITASGYYGLTIKPNVLYNITLMPGAVVSYVPAVSPDKPFKVIVKVPHKGVNPAVDLYCSFVSIPFNVSGVYVVYRYPVFYGGKVVADRVCLYVNGTFAGCYVVKPLFNKTITTITDKIDALQEQKTIRVKLHGILVAAVVPAYYCSMQASVSILGSANPPKILTICDPYTWTCTNSTATTIVEIKYVPLS